MSDPSRDHDYDVLIIGGGLVGVTLACALDGLGLRLGLVEATPLNVSQHPSYDDRTLALAQGTRRIFQTLGLWPTLADSATPIRQIHISERGAPGCAWLDSQAYGVAALGYVVEARVLGATLLARLPQLSSTTLLCPAHLERVAVTADAAQAVIRHPDQRLETVRTKLLIAADGADSPVRSQLGIGAWRWNYDQHAVIANVTPTRPHAHVAYERFTDDGPVALLPMRDQRCAMVCTVRDAELAAMLALDDAGWLNALQHRFGQRLGRFQRIGRRQSYPLFMLQSRTQVQPRAALLGNAAHTLHPIAGQGFNLGVRDVVALAEVLADAHRAGEDFGTRPVLNRYADWRRGDQRRTLAFTDALHRLFDNPLLPVRALRNLGLLGFAMLPPLKQALVRQAMGLEGRVPKLTRGLAL